MPLAAKTSASLTFAVQMPIDPLASCSLAIAGHLCVLACGRLATFVAGQLRPHRREVLLELVEVDAQRRRVEIPFRDALQLVVGRKCAHLGVRVTRGAARKADRGRSGARGDEKIPAREGVFHGGSLHPNATDVKIIERPYRLRA